MLLDWLDRVRQRSPDTRRQYAFAGALIVTGLITVAWATTLPARFASLDDEATASSTAASSNSAIGAYFEKAKSNLANAIGALRDEPAATTTTAVSTSTATTSDVVVPRLRPETIEAVTARGAASSTPPPRAVRIATTSSRAATSSTESTP